MMLTCLDRVVVSSLQLPLHGLSKTGLLQPERADCLCHQLSRHLMQAPTRLPATHQWRAGGPNPRLPGPTCKAHAAAGQFSQPPQPTVRRLPLALVVQEGSLLLFSFGDHCCTHLVEVLSTTHFPWR